MSSSSTMPGPVAPGLVPSPESQSKGGDASLANESQEARDHAKPETGQMKSSQLAKKGRGRGRAKADTEIAGIEQSPGGESFVSDLDVDFGGFSSSSKKGHHQSSGGRKDGSPSLPTGNARSSNFAWRPPQPPQSSSLKALPSRHVQDFLSRVQDGKYQQAQESFRQVRVTLGGRSRSKEAFGGMRALLHYLLETYGWSDRVQEAIRMLEEMKISGEARLVGPAAFNAILRGLLARGALQQARFIVRTEMPRMGYTADQASLNLLMDIVARSGSSNMDEAWDILEEMQRQNMKADKYTVSILTKHIYERAGDRWSVPRGVALVEHFLLNQPEDVDEVLVNSLLDVFCRMGDMPRLEATLTKMKEYSIRGSAVTYGTIVKAYGRAGNIEKVLQAWEEMQREGLEANAVTYGCMLDACVKCGHLDNALQVFELMKKQGLHRNTILYATLIKGFAKFKDPSAARLLHKEMIAEGVLCNVVVFNSLIDACVRANDLQAAAEVLQDMTTAGVAPDLITFSTLIKGYCSNGDLRKAIRLQEELQARELHCDEIVYNSLLEGCVKAGSLDFGLRLFTEMRQKAVRPSAVTFSILVKLLARAGRLDLAMHLVAKEMREIYGVAPTRMVWSCLITCCLKARDLPRAVMALDLLDVEGAAVGTARASMYASVIEGSLTAGEVSTALSLLHRAYARAPLEDASQMLLSTELLKRAFETAVLRGPEAEARALLTAISGRISPQVLHTLNDVVQRACRRRGSYVPGAQTADELPEPGSDLSFGASAPSTRDLLNEASTAELSWPSPLWNQPPPSALFPPHHFVIAEAMAAAHAAAAAVAMFAPPWDPTAAVSGHWPYGFDRYSWPESYLSTPPPWETAGMHWPSPAGDVSPSLDQVPAEDLLSSAPPTTPLATRSFDKARDNEQTPVTTAGRSSWIHSPEDLDEYFNDEIANRSPLQKMLFSNDSVAKREASNDADHELSKRFLDGPPGLC